MLDVGFQELIIIFVVALIIFGPKKLPEIGKNLGRAIGELRRALEGVKQSIEAEAEPSTAPETERTSVGLESASQPGSEPASPNRAEETDGESAAEEVATAGPEGSVVDDASRATQPVAESGESDRAG